MADQPTADRGPKASEPLPRRQALQRLATFMVGTPVLARALGEEWRWSRPLDPSAASAPAAAGQEYIPNLMSLVNLHDFEALARRMLSIRTFDYVAAGSADDLTLRENAAAFDRYWIRRRVMQDASGIDLSVDLFGAIDHPILLGPAGLRNLLHPDGHRLTALAAHNTGAVLVGASVGLMEELARSNEAPTWWAVTLGHDSRADAAEWAARNEGAGATALAVSIDYPYTASRDRPARHGWQREWSGTGNYSTADGDLVFQPGAIDPYYPSLTWEWIDWAKSASSLPVVLKGIVTGADARMAVQRGADAVVVSNHGGRTLDGERATLDSLPEVVEAVGGRIPVLVDGGIRRGGDVVKALGLGATAILIGRPYMWGLGTFGQEGAERVIELLKAETSIALGLAGSPRARDIVADLVRPAWVPWRT